MDQKKMLSDKLRLLVATFGSERIKFNEKISSYTHSKLGGQAEAFFIATNQKELVKILDVIYQLKIPFFLFGNGTKILISDEGIKGLVIKNRTNSIKLSGMKGKVGKFGLGVEEASIEADSGVSLEQLNNYLNQQNLIQLKTSSFIQSSLGGALFWDLYLQNYIQKVKIWQSGKIDDINIKELNRSQIILSVLIKVKAKF